MLLSVPVGVAVDMKETHDNMKLLLDCLNYVQELPIEAGWRLESCCIAWPATWLHEILPFLV
jgi:hypothetical protein